MPLSVFIAVPQYGGGLAAPGVFNIIETADGSSFFVQSPSPSITLNWVYLYTFTLCFTSVPDIAEIKAIAGIKVPACIGYDSLPLGGTGGPIYGFYTDLKRVDSGACGPDNAGLFFYCRDVVEYPIVITLEAGSSVGPEVIYIVAGMP